MLNETCEELALGIRSSPYRALIMVARKVGEHEGIPEENLVKLVTDYTHPAIPIGKFMDNLTLEKRNPFDPNAVALRDGDALALDEESEEDEDHFILKDAEDC